MVKIWSWGISLQLGTPNNEFSLLKAIKAEASKSNTIQQRLITEEASMAGKEQDPEELKGNIRRT